MLRPLLIFSQSDDLSADPDQLLKKPSDLALHCLQRQGISGISMMRVNKDHLVCVSYINCISWFLFSNLLKGTGYA